MALSNRGRRSRILQGQEIDRVPSIDQAGHTGRLSIQISENPPPNVWRKSYPASVCASDDFGTP